jgi:hypothetical protein
MQPPLALSILFFTEISWTSEDKSTMQKSFDGVVQSTNSNISVEIIDNSQFGYHNKTGGFVYGYSFMCKFFLLDIYKILQSRSIDYYMRLDTDCFIVNLPYNVFSYVVDHKFEYLYPCVDDETHPPTKRTLPGFIKSYISSMSAICNNGSAIIPQDRTLSLSLESPRSSSILHYYNNLHIGKVSFFLSAHVQHFLQTAVTNENFRESRWGDSPLQAYAVRMYMPQARVGQFKKLEYVHGSHRMRVKNGVKRYEQGLLGKMLASVS